MGRVAITLIAVAFASAAGSAALAATPVEEALRAELINRYPAVQRWVIRPFRDIAPDESSSDTPAVVQVGSRSAVRVGHRLHWYTVEGFQNVISTDRAVAAGGSLEAVPVTAEEKDVLAAGCAPVTRAEMLAGMRARRALRANAPICTDFIEPRPVVARGDKVTVRYVGERINVVTQGIAQADANLGDELSVRNLRSSDSFHALVSGAGEVTLHE